MSGKLEGKIALVTGGTAGIGLATAQRFVKEGAYVFVTGRRQAELDAAAKLMSGHVTAVKADSSNLDDLDKLFAQIKREKGRLDIVYANAGGSGSFAPIGGISEQHFDHTFDTNVKGTLFTVQKALPLVPDGGSIIMTASTAGSTAMPAFSVYSASKSGILCPLLDVGFEGPQNPSQLSSVLDRSKLRASRVLRRMKNSGGGFTARSLRKRRWVAWGSRTKLPKWLPSLLPKIQAS